MATGWRLVLILLCMIQGVLNGNTIRDVNAQFLYCFRKCLDFDNYSAFKWQFSWWLFVLNARALAALAVLHLVITSLKIHVSNGLYFKGPLQILSTIFISSSALFLLFSDGAKLCFPAVCKVNFGLSLMCMLSGTTFLLSLLYILCLNVFLGPPFPMTCSLFSIVSFQRWRREQTKNHTLILPPRVVRDHVAEWIGLSDCECSLCVLM